MPRFAVVFVPDGDDPQIEIITAANWREAALSHALSPWQALVEPDENDDDNDGDDNPNVIPEDYERAQSDSVDISACLFAYAEIK